VGEGDEHADDIVLTVPGEPDFVSLVRIAARIVAGRAGHDADARSRLQAAVGTAFFALTEEASADSAVAMHLRVGGDDTVTIELVVRLDDVAVAAERLEQAGIRHEVGDDGRTVRARLAS
jgi:hypothetical protein